MTLELTPHPSTPCRAVDRIEVDVSRLQRSLVLCFTLYGDLSDVKGLPATGTARSGAHERIATRVLFLVKCKRERITET